MADEGEKMLSREAWFILHVMLGVGSQGIDSVVVGVKSIRIRQDDVVITLFRDGRLEESRWPEPVAP
jgi:hypothetical protein